MSNLFVITYIFLLIEDILQQYISGLGYFDEAIAFIAIILIFFNLKKIKYNYSYKGVLLCLLMVLIIGITGNIIYNYQKDTMGIFKDILAIIKFPICIVGYSFLPNNQISKTNRKITLVSKTFVLVLFSCAIYTYLFHSSLFSSGERNGILMYTFLYSHNTFLVTSVVSCMAIFVAQGKNSKVTKVYIFICILLLLSTGRFKVLAPIVFLFICYFLFSKNKQRSLLWLKLIVGLSVVLIVSLYIAMPRIEDYIYYGETAARSAFYMYGIEIANNSFPIGSGFCTFASSLSYKYNSLLYKIYGLYGISGLTIEEGGAYAADTYWPYIYGQFGYIGLFFYILMLYYVVKSSFSQNKELDSIACSKMLLLVYAINAAFAEAFFTNASAVIFAVIFAVYLRPKSV